MKPSQPRNKPSLSVAERVSAVMQLRQFENSHNPITIAEVCRRSGVNRSNLYATHPDLVAAILRRPINSNRDMERVEKKRSSVNADVGRAEKNSREKALLYLCLELRAEVDKLRAAKKGGARGDGKRVGTKANCKENDRS